MPNINTFQARLDTACRDTLYETIDYKPADEELFVPVMADVDYGDEVGEFNNAALVLQAIVVSVLRTDVPEKPGGGVRIKLARLDGQVFSPVNVRLSDGGTDWEFGVKEEDA